MLPTQRDDNGCHTIYVEVGGRKRDFDLSSTFSPSLNGGRPLYGHVLHRKASPSPHCKLQNY